MMIFSIKSSVFDRRATLRTSAVKGKQQFHIRFSTPVADFSGFPLSRNDSEQLFEKCLHHELIRQGISKNLFLDSNGRTYDECSLKGVYISKQLSMWIELV